MKTTLILIATLMLLPLANVANAREIKIKWRDTVEFKELEASRQKAAKEKKFITILVSNKTYDDETQGAEAAVEVIEDTIKALKSISIIVRTSYENARSIKQDAFGRAAIEGLQKAGNGLPMIIVIDPATNKLIEVVKPADVHNNGSKAFRSLKKKGRDLKKSK